MRRTCFVMRPFREKFDELYQFAIAPAVAESGLDPELGKSYEPGSIPEEIDRKISSAAVAIAILTEGNWNVAYEMGIAHKAGVPVFALIEGSPEEVPVKVPFDVRHQRVFTYTPTRAGYDELRKLLIGALPKLQDENLLGQMLAPPSLRCEQAIIAASPLAYRDARRKVGGASQFKKSFSDHVGIRGLLRALAITRGFDCLPELWNPNDFLDVVLTGNDQFAPTDMTIYSIGSPKSNRFTGLLMDKFFENRRPRFAFVADESSPDLRDVRISLKRDGLVYLEGIDPNSDDRRFKDIGLVIRGPNPYFENGMMLILAGRSALGTEAACRAAVEPRGIQMILQHLDADAMSRGLDASLRDYKRAFWVAVTMGANFKTRDRDPKTLVIQTARYFDW
jgi:hypothetical protein